MYWQAVEDEAIAAALPAPVTDETAELTTVERQHLLTLLIERKESGDYYGHREQYYKRTDKLIERFGK